MPRVASQPRIPSPRHFGESRRRAGATKVAAFTESLLVCRNDLTPGSSSLKGKGKLRRCPKSVKQRRCRHRQQPTTEFATSVSSSLRRFGSTVKLFVASHLR